MEAASVGRERLTPALNHGGKASEHGSQPRTRELRDLAHGNQLGGDGGCGGDRAFTFILDGKVYECGAEHVPRR